MKNLIFLVMFSLFILPAVCFAREKLQIEDTQFDLKAASSCTGEVDIRGWTYIETGLTHGGFDTPIPFVDIVLYQEKYKTKLDSTISGKKGNFRFCNVRNGDYLLIAKMQGYDDSKYRLTIRDEINYTPKGFPADFAMYKTGKSPKDNCKIEGEIRLPKENDWDYTYLKDIKVQIAGTKTKVKKNFTTDDYSGWFEFKDLKPDTYRVIAKKSNNKVTKKIKLEKNMIYFFYIDIDWNLN